MAFTALPYANPDAPKGGRLVEGVLGTFDSLNPLIVQGLAVQAIRGYVVESLLARGYDEPFTLYGLLARTVETDDARSYVTFALDPAAHFSDGTPVTADDVVFSWQLLRDHGRPNHRTYYAKVAKAEMLDPRTVRFDFADGSDRELPLILGLMPVLPQARRSMSATFEKYDFGQADRQRALRRRRRRCRQKRHASSAIRIIGAAHLPINRGLWNFDELRFDYYRDANAYFEAFKAGLYDVRSETDPSRWQTGYDFPAVRDGRVVKEAFHNGLPKFASDFVFNTRRPIFADIRVRQAHRAVVRLPNGSTAISSSISISAARASSTIPNCPPIIARPTSANARCWRPSPTRCAPTCSTAPGRRRSATAPAATATRCARRSSCSTPPATSSRARRCASAQAAEPFAFEIMVTNRDEERLALAFSSNLARAGIDGAGAPGRCRAIRSAPGVVRFRHDRIPLGAVAVARQRAGVLLGLGGRRSARHRAIIWACAAPAVDAMIAAMLRAREQRRFRRRGARARSRADLRLLTSCRCFICPSNGWRAGPRSQHPARTSLSGYLPETWWRQPPNAARALQ